MVIHELLGHFAGSEGVGHFYNDLRTRLCPAALSIPHRAQTMLAPGLHPSPELLARAPPGQTLIGPGQKYLALPGLLLGPASALLLAPPQPAEDVQFNDGTALGVTVLQGRDLAFELDDGAAQVEGWYAWLRFQPDAAGGWADTFEGDGKSHGTSWQVVFLPWIAPSQRTGSPPGKRPRTPHTVHARLCVSSLGVTPEYVFDFWVANGDGFTATTPITLGELYPLTGGDYCRHCRGTTKSLRDQETRFRACSRCHGAYHRACVIELGWEGLTCGWWNSESWLCGPCRQTSEAPGSPRSP